LQPLQKADLSQVGFFISASETSNFQLPILNTGK